MTTVQTGFVTAIPSLAVVTAMVVSGPHADRTGERAWPVAAPFLASVAGFLLAAATASPVVGLIGPAPGVALINSNGSTGGFFGPAVIEWTRQASGSFSGSLIFLAAQCIMSAAVALLLGRTKRNLLITSAPGQPVRASQEPAR